MTLRTVFLNQYPKRDLFSLPLSDDIVPYLSTSPFDDAFSNAIRDAYDYLAKDPTRIVAARNFDDFTQSLLTIYSDPNHYLHQMSFMCLAAISQYRPDLFENFRFNHIYEACLLYLIDGLPNNAVYASLIVQLNIYQIQDPLIQLRLGYCISLNEDVSGKYALALFGLVRVLHLDKQCLLLYLLILRYLLLYSPPSPVLFEFDQQQLVQMLELQTYPTEILSIARAFQAMQSLEVFYQLNPARFVDTAYHSSVIEAAMILLLNNDSISDSVLSYCQIFLTSENYHLRRYSVLIYHKFGFDLRIIVKYLYRVDNFNDSEYIIKTVLRGMKDILAGDVFAEKHAFCRLTGAKERLQELIGQLGCGIDAVLREICEYL